ncbi:hypothetical protein dsx2_2262 [Desulfovibrio sp. X2]|uniref:hypothetical protein n=1 Tax=Desulfovibrio sp. X2 TaxID=941449 RepID=UPI000358EB70|nr:hypothetical protein [Desulfovibrio sp. X2]EPR43645.1 hypothetical protein dsx2_2262 [Desulfovibrio sp. X2]
MSKENVKCMSGVLASVFAHLGGISKEEAREICGLDEGKFEEVYSKAGLIAKKLDNISGDKMDHFLDYFAKEIDDYVRETTHYFYLT